VLNLERTVFAVDLRNVAGAMMDDLRTTGRIIQMHDAIAPGSVLGCSTSTVFWILKLLVVGRGVRTSFAYVAKSG
jgi:hypothetical protein